MFDFKKIIIIFGISILLTGCSTFFSKTQLKNQNLVKEKKHVSFDKKIKDWTLETAALATLNKKSATLRYSHITPIIFNHTALLVGQVFSEKDKQEAFEVMQSFPRIDVIYNELTVQPNLAYSERIRDSYTTSKLRVRLLLLKNLPIKNLKVITEENIIYLIGKLNTDVYKKVMSLVNQIHGNKKIVSFIEVSDKSK